MRQLNEEQLKLQIEAFISRKHQEYPELALRGEKKAESIGYVIADKISEFVASVRLIKLAH